MKDMDFLFKTCTSDTVYLYQDSLVIHFEGKRSVVSTSNANGGYREDLEYLFNHSCESEIRQNKTLERGNNLIEHYQALAKELGLPVDRTTGLSTAARMENRSVVTFCHQALKVTTIATAGIDHNGGRAGDPAGYDEFTNQQLLPTPGTINIFLFINACLDPGTLTRAIITATEAKTAALQELMANSMYSEDLATGSGTDGIIAVAEPCSKQILFNAGKHCILGELIGKSVKQAVKEALDKQSGMNKQRQASIEWQNKRYGITASAIIERYYQLYPHSTRTSEQTVYFIENLLSNNLLTAQTAAIIHLIDQNRWGLLQDETLTIIGYRYLNFIRESQALSPISPSCMPLSTYQSLISHLIQTFAEIYNFSNYSPDINKISYLCPELVPFRPTGVTD